MIGFFIGLITILALSIVAIKKRRQEKSAVRGERAKRGQASTRRQNPGNRPMQHPAPPHLENYPFRIQQRTGDDALEKIAASMLGFLTSHTDFDALRATLGDRPDGLLEEFIFFRYFALSHHASRCFADTRIHAHLMAEFALKVKSCFRLNPTLRTIGGSYERFEEEARRRNDLLANGLEVIKEKEPGGPHEPDEATSALASFLITLRILHPQLTIDRDSIPPQMIVLMQREFRLAAERMARAVQTAD